MSYESYMAACWEALNRRHVEDEREPEMSDEFCGGLLTEGDE